ncbi:MAG: DUF1801 domain-containing protein [Bryobacterales bacterium]|nr:DUF1801 domain-containing protein [Bryobacterales bacterium]
MGRRCINRLAYRGGLPVPGYISLYVCAADERGCCAERYKEALPKANIGKSCVRFRRMADLDPQALRKLIKEGAKTKAAI